MDLYGLGMSFMGYWNTDILFLRVLLITGPAGYLIATGMYMAFAEEERARIAKEGEEEDVINPAITGGTKKKDDIAKPPKLQRPGCQMRFYHFLPIVRYYIVIKEREPDDIEAIFRVNSLSSFSLGIAQICGLLFSHIFGEEFGIFHYINIGSQCVNWFITFLYFTTDVAGLMRATISVDAMKVMKDDFLRKKHREWDMLCEQAADGTSDALIRKRQFADRVDKHIVSLSTTGGIIDKAELSSYEMQWKFTVLQKLQLKSVAKFAEIK